MREPPRITTPFKEYERQVFPQGLDALNEIYADFGFVILDPKDSQPEKFREQVAQTRNLAFCLLDRPRTQDGYGWQAGLTLGSDLSSGRDLAFLFPESSGNTNYRTNLRRSIGVYTRSEVKDRVIDLVVEELILGIRGVQKPRP